MGERWRVKPNINKTHFSAGTYDTKEEAEQRLKEILNNVNYDLPGIVIQCKNWKFYYKDKLIDIFETEEAKRKNFKKEFSNDPEKYYNELTEKSKPHLTVGLDVENRTKK